MKDFLSIFENDILFLKRRPLAVSMLVNLVILVLFLIFFSIRFDTNDDVGMIMLVSGILGSQSDKIIFSNILIGKLLVFLYHQNLSVPWYLCYLLTGLTASNVALFYILLIRRPQYKSFIFFLFYMLSLGLIAFSSIQFTVIASLIIFSGILLILTYKRQLTKKHFKFPPPALIFGVIFIALGSLYRFESVYLLFILFLPLIIYIFIKEKIRKNNGFATLSKCLALVISLFLSLSLHFYDKYEYQKDKEITSFIEFNTLRAGFNDYRSLEGLKTEDFNQCLKIAGWSVNDYKMLMSWFYWDYDKYNINVFKKVLNLNIVNQNTMKVKKLTTRFLYHDFISDKIFLIALFLSAIAFIFNGFSRENLKIFFISLSTVFILYILISSFLKPPGIRVFYIFLIFIAFSPYLLKSALVNKNRLKNYLAIPCLAIIIFIGAFFIASDVNLLKRNKLDADEFHEIIKRIPDNDNLYIIWAQVLPWEFMPPIENIEKLSKFHFLCLGWNVRHPVMDAIIKNYNLSDIYLDMINNKKIKLIAWDKGEYAETKYLYTKYMIENYGIRTSFVKEIDFISPNKLYAPFSTYRVEKENEDSLKYVIK